MSQPYQIGNRKYLKIGEAAVQYNVSRVKLWRLIQSGRLDAVKDPRDERAKLVKEDDVARALVIGDYDGDATKGRITAELAARMDAFVAEVFKGNEVSGDSTEFIRAERERRSEEIEDRVWGRNSS